MLRVVSKIIGLRSSLMRFSSESTEQMFQGLDRERRGRIIYLLLPIAQASLSRSILKCCVF